MKLNKLKFRMLCPNCHAYVYIHSVGININSLQNGNIGISYDCPTCKSTLQIQLQSSEIIQSSEIK
jgi:transposase-like protein